MRLFHRGLIYKITSGIRAIVFFIIRGKSLKARFPFTLGKQSGIYTKKGGQVEIGKKSMFYDFVEIQSRGKIKMGNHCSVNNFTRIIAFEKIEMGNHVVIAQFVSILDHDHNFELENGKMKIEGYTTAPIKIGNNVWIADKATILKGVTIGDNVVIAAHTLVNKDIPSNCIVGGIPCKVLKQLEEEK